MTVNGDADDALAAEYVIGVLSGPERRVAENRITRDQDFARRVARWEGRLEGLNENYGSLPVPGRVKSQIDTKLFAEGRRHFGLLGWAFSTVALASLVFGLVVTFALKDSPPVLRAQLASDSGTVFDISVDRQAGTITVDPRFAQLRSDSVYELWLVPDAGVPVSLGVFATPGSLSTGLVTGLSVGATLAVSVEPAGGSPTGAPTGDIVAVGQLDDA